MFGSPVDLVRLARASGVVARVWLALLIVSICVVGAEAQGPYAYVGSGTSANCCLTVIDTSTNSVVKNIPVTGLGIPFGITPDQSKIYVADYNNNLLDVIDTASNTLVTALSIPGSPNAVVVTPNGNFAYVAAANGNVYVISTASNALVATIPIGFQVTWVAVTPDGSSVYAAGSGAVIAQISTATNKIATTFVVPITAEQQSAGCCLAGPVFTPAGTTGYIEESSGSLESQAPGTVNVYSFPGNTAVGTISVGAFPYDLVTSPDGTKLYVTNAVGNSVSVINTSTNTVVATIPVGNSPESVAFTPNGTLAYVGNTFDNSISIINTATNSVINTLQLAVPFGMIIPSAPPASQATALALNPPNLVFANQVIGTSSENSSIQVTNPSGVTAVTITSITVTGPNPTDYIVSNTCPVPPLKLGTQASCFVNVAFAPLAAGTRTALVQIVNNNGTANSTQSVPLSGGATAPEPTTTAVILNFGTGSNVSQTATFDCPSNTVPCTDPNAHSLKLTVPTVLTPFSLSVTAYEVSVAEANGDCESGQTEFSDFDCRFVDYFPIQTLNTGDVIVPQCIPYSNGNCVFYRVGDTPPTTYYQGPVTEYVAWNNVGFIPPSNYQANNPRLYDDPDDPPYNLNHQFVFDITNYYQPTGEFVGLDPGISGQTLHFNDFVVAYPGVTSTNYTFAIQPPLKANKAAVFAQGNSIPVVFTLTPNMPAGIAMRPPHRTGYSVLLDTNNTGCGDFSGAHQPTMTVPASQNNFVYDPMHQQYTLKLVGIYKPGNYKLLISSDLIPEQCAPFTVSK